jgi:hypothetical protein
MSAFALKRRRPTYGRIVPATILSQPWIHQRNPSSTPGGAGFGFHAEAPAEGLTVQASLPSNTPDGLSLADVARLMDQPSVANRIDTAEKVAGQIRAGKLSGPAEEMALDILMHFARDAEVAVRQAIAWQFRNTDRLPDDLAVRLAEDVAEVAAPVLSYHAGFEDAFLTSVIGTGDQLKMAAIAVRRAISTIVSDALIDAGDVAVIPAPRSRPTALAASWTGMAIAKRWRPWWRGIRCCRLP